MHEYDERPGCIAWFIGQMINQAFGIIAWFFWAGVFLVLLTVCSFPFMMMEKCGG